MEYRSGYIGGDLSYAQREPFLIRLRALPAIDVGASGQCRCRNTTYVCYRGRVYCPRCGRRPDSDSGLVRRVLAG